MDEGKLCMRRQRKRPFIKSKSFLHIWIYPNILSVVLFIHRVRFDIESIRSNRHLVIKDGYLVS